MSQNEIGYMMAKGIAAFLFYYAGYALLVSRRFGRHLAKRSKYPGVQLLEEHHRSRHWRYFPCVLLGAMMVVFLRESSDTPRQTALFTVHASILAVWTVTLIGGYVFNGIRWPSIHKYVVHTHIWSYMLILVTGSIMLWRL